MLEEYIKVGEPVILGKGTKEAPAKHDLEGKRQMT